MTKRSRTTKNQLQAINNKKINNKKYKKIENRDNQKIEKRVGNFLVQVNVHNFNILVSKVKNVGSSGGLKIRALDL